MANAEQIKALIRSHAEGDDERFYSLAMQVAAQASRNGHAKFSRDLRALIDKVRAESGATTPAKARVVHIKQPRGDLAGLLSATTATARLSDMTLEPSIRERLERVVVEQRRRSLIREHALNPIQKLLLIGPPGTGKTMTASALAGDLGLPLFTIQIDGLITKYLGETAAKLRLVFEEIRQTRAVYLFDEFDALGSDRAARNDVGEIRRILNSFLQFLELDDSDSLIVAATNNPRLLDPALFRRFDLSIEYGLPGEELLDEMLRARLAYFDTRHLDFKAAIKAALGLSYAEIAKACEQAAKNSVLRGDKEIREAELLAALKERRAHA